MARLAHVILHCWHTPAGAECGRSCRHCGTAGKFEHGLTQSLCAALAGHSWTYPIYKLGVTVQRCLQSTAPCCAPTSNVASTQRLRSVSRYQLIVPWHRRNKFGRRAFFVVGPMTWNSLPDSFRDPTLSDDTFRAALKTVPGHVAHWRRPA